MLVQITHEAERLARHIGALKGTPEQAPEILNAVRMDAALSVALGMVHGHMNELILNALVSRRGIGHHDRTGFDAGANGILHMRARCAADHRSAELTTYLGSFQQPLNDCLSMACASCILLRIKPQAAAPLRAAPG